jgi:hypothetical protein
LKECQARFQATGCRGQLQASCIVQVSSTRKKSLCSGKPATGAERGLCTALSMSSPLRKASRIARKCHQFGGGGSLSGLRGQETPTLESLGLRLWNCVPYIKSVHVQSIAGTEIHSRAHSLMFQIEIYRVLPDFGPNDAIPWELPDSPSSSPTPTAPSSGLRNRDPFWARH